MRKLTLIIFLLASSYIVQSQTAEDALRYSFITHGGTARYMGMSGAFGALGADFSSISTNPAGIGTFKKSRFMFSPYFSYDKIDANYTDRASSNENVFFKLGNMGLILNLKPYEDDDTEWKSVAFGIGYNNLRNLSRDITISGYTERSSYLDLFMLDSDGDPPSSFEIGSKRDLAYQSYLTDVYNSTDNTYIHPYYYTTYVNQLKKIDARGGIGEYVFSLGGNYADKFQIGASFGIQNVRYKEVSQFSESSDSTNLESYIFSESIETKGSGYNFKLGIIYRPENFVRIGLAFHTPTFYKLKDIFSYRFESHWRTPVDGQTEWIAKTDPEFEYSYELYTPMRLITSVALVLSRFSILSVDYEYVNYGRARMRSEYPEDFAEENENIKKSYGAGHNLRLGAEVRLAPIYLRGGLSYYGSPTSTKFNANGAVKGYSLGLGLKSEKVYIDVAFNHSFYDKDYKLYDYESRDDGSLASEYAKFSITEDILNFTIGFKF